MATQAKASLFDLYPQDRAALERIKERLCLGSNALAVRIALRQLAKRLEANHAEAPEAPEAPAQAGQEGAA